MKVKHTLSIREKLGVVLTFVERHLKLELRFKWSLSVSFANMFFMIVIWLFISMMASSYFTGGTIDQYRGNFFPYIILGLAIQNYVRVSNNAYLQSVQKAYWNNTMEVFVSSPMGLRTYFFSTILWAYISATAYISLYFILGFGLFGAPILMPAGGIIVIPVLFLLITSLAGIGLMSASMFLLANAKGQIEPISWIVTTMSALFTGVYFPPSYLPEQVRWVSHILPATYALDATRRVFMNGEGIMSPHIHFDILMLVLFTLILLPIGAWMFLYSTKKAEREGTLARWS